MSSPSSSPIRKSVDTIPNNNNNSQNAFDVLMMSQPSSSSSSSSDSKKSRRCRRTNTPTTTTTRNGGGLQFLPCPAGCGKHILERDINVHLDRCMIVMTDDDDDDNNKFKNNSVDDSRCSRGNDADNNNNKFPHGAKHHPPIREQTYNTPKIFQLRNTTVGTTTMKKRRVTCPSCSTSYPTSVINIHLDTCIDRGRNSIIEHGSSSSATVVATTTTTTTNLNRVSTTSARDAAWSNNTTPSSELTTTTTTCCTVNNDIGTTPAAKAIILTPPPPTVLTELSTNSKQQQAKDGSLPIILCSTITAHERESTMVTDATTTKSSPTLLVAGTDPVNDAMETIPNNMNDDNNAVRSCRPSTTSCSDATLMPCPTTTTPTTATIVQSNMVTIPTVHIPNSEIPQQLCDITQPQGSTSTTNQPPSPLMSSTTAVMMHKFPTFS